MGARARSEQRAGLARKGGEAPRAHRSSVGIILLDWRWWESNIIKVNTKMIWREHMLATMLHKYIKVD